MSYMIIVRDPIKGTDDYMEAEYDGCEYADREDAEAVLMCAKDQGLESWIEEIYMIRDDIFKLSENYQKLPRIVPAIIKAIRNEIVEGITKDCDTIEISLTWKKGESTKLTSKYVSTKLKVDYNGYGKT